MSPERAAPNLVATIRSLPRRFGGLKLLAAGGATALALTLAVGAGAAPSPFEPVAEVLGLGGEHGAAVSDAVHEAKAVASAAGDPIGPAVSEAACMAAHDRSTLPHGDDEEEAADEPVKDCTHPSNLEEVMDSSDEDEAEATVEESDELLDEDELNHGQTVSQAVHEAMAAAKEAGEKVGPAVSQAACTAAHNRSMLPGNAPLVPPGQEGKEPKDCTHPSNVQDGDGEPEATSDVAGESNGHGKQSAPGQLKKQGD